MRRADLLRHLGSAIGIAVLAMLALLPAVGSSYVVFVTAQMLAFLYIALALEVSQSFGRILSFCTGAFFALGAYSAYYLCQKVTSELVLVLTGCALLSAGAGALVAMLVVRMKGAHSTVVGTLAIGSISLMIANSLSAYTGGEDGLTLRHAVSLFGMPASIGVERQTYYLVLIPAAAYLMAYLRLRQTSFGLVMRAVGENEVRSAQLGFNVALRRVVVFAFSAGIAGFGGGAYCILIGHVSTALFDPLLSLDAVLWTTVGGIGSPFGALIGTIVVYPTVELSAGILRYVDAVIGALLIGTALLFPRGIMGLFDRLADRSSADTEAQTSTAFDADDRHAVLSPGE